ncbi:ATP-grasp fold amidoligase family protein [Ilyobacter polytropus]|uniref:Uncharacterized protein n=1 Tax=Ilyobacter polytropus (strain ATCC 51220 / DSM 2926 / LMG 16218 / CuHBu1) TaxID=572544 RepID=E3HB26_ILYPC|nr:ATP-grasp fold amidoligase family protein [Ilyobacter polytropus]ADO82175.1 conserved hypothetical protein [Ilyobacter polytropus DSM 2926]
MRLKRMLKNVIRDSLRMVMPKLWYLKLRFYLTHGYRLNLKKSKTWNEKIQYRKLNCDSEFLSNFTDKIVVRDYVKEIIGEEYLIPLLGYYEKITPKDIENLPKSFVIKTSNGSGGENIKVIWDKNKEDIIKLCKQFNKYLDMKIGHKIDELYYDVKRPRILVEKLMLDENGNIPMDLKFHTFVNGGKPSYIIQVDLSRFEDHSRDWYGENWELLDLKQTYKRSNEILSEPKKFNQMKEIAHKLVKNFNYCRVDLYNLDGEIYFGELTFCHGSGWEKIEPREWDYKMGEMWYEDR